MSDSAIGFYTSSPWELDDSKVGRLIVRCPHCGAERWYGYGPCFTCRSYLPSISERPDGRAGSETNGEGR